VGSSSFTEPIEPNNASLRSMSQGDDVQQSMHSLVARTHDRPDRQSIGDYSRSQAQVNQGRWIILRRRRRGGVLRWRVDRQVIV